MEKAQALGLKVIKDREEAVSTSAERIEAARIDFLSAIAEHGVAQRDLFETSVDLTKVEMALPEEARQAGRPSRSPAAAAFELDPKDIARSFGSPPLFPAFLL